MDFVRSKITWVEFLVVVSLPTAFGLYSMTQDIQLGKTGWLLLVLPLSYLTLRLKVSPLNTENRIVRNVVYTLTGLLLAGLIVYFLILLILGLSVRDWIF